MQQIMMPMPSRKGRPETPNPLPARAWRGAGIGAALAAYATLSYLATRLDSSLGFLGDLIVAGLVGVSLMAATGALFAGLLAVLRKASLLWAGVVAGSLGAVAGSIWLAGGYREAAVFALLLVVPIALVGGAVGLAWDRGLRRPWVAGFLALSLLLAGADAWWLVSPGTAAPAGAAPVTETAPPLIGAGDPGAPGPYEVRTLTYGSGQDRRRTEYGARVALTTDPVDASPLLPMWAGFSGWVRRGYWGFGPGQVPVNARVWYPSGDGPFPLVLMAHGNHAMTVASETGYAYLGELLASRGYIVAAVDENFLNASPSAARLNGENAARAWLLLQHLEAWQGWNATVGTPFFRRVDMSNIALIGHSRGGEAAYLAAVLNDLPYLPDNAAVELGFHFKIKAVATLAPTDGQYQPAGQLPGLDGVSYLTLQGSLDSDVSNFAGALQYERVTLPAGSDAFKAAVMIQGANHGQFNTAWGRHDWSDLAGLLLNTESIMAPAEQRRIAAVYLSAFLDAALRGNRAYRPLFQDARAGADWLPAAGISSRYAAATFHLLSGFAEDLDLLSTTAPGGAQRGENLAAWREVDEALYVAWAPTGEGAVPAYTIALPDSLAQAWALGEGRALTFALADARELSAGLEPLDLTIELVLADGTAARLPLSHWAGVSTRQGRRLTKLGPIEPLILGTPAPVFQTYTLPLADFAAGAGFDPARVRSVRFRFDRVQAGAVLIDDVGFM
ncbi:MAG: Chlorophyllase [Symbiobacteriaceae bacterium]|jgi:dienelactone hydrolase|nr:Chlorophyllase [Symbiobacteriaceae bacterium]